MGLIFQKNSVMTHTQFWIFEIALTLYATIMIKILK